jgi:hypothetical protein
MIDDLVKSLQARHSGESWIESRTGAGVQDHLELLDNAVGRNARSACEFSNFPVLNNLPRLKFGCSLLGTNPFDFSPAA